MSEQEIIQLFKDRYLNSKTNNFIFSRIDDFSILDHIPDKCCISTPENESSELLEIKSNCPTKNRIKQNKVLEKKM